MVSPGCLRAILSTAARTRDATSDTDSPLGARVQWIAFARRPIVRIPPLHIRDEQSFPFPLIDLTQPLVDLNRQLLPFTDDFGGLKRALQITDVDQVDNVS